MTFLLLLTGPMAVHRTLSARWSAWPLVGGLFIYNGFLFVGLMNYLFGVGLAVWGLAAGSLRPTADAQPGGIRPEKPHRRSPWPGRGHGRLSDPPRAAFW